MQLPHQITERWSGEGGERDSSDYDRVEFLDHALTALERARALLLAATDAAAAAERLEATA